MTKAQGKNKSAGDRRKMLVFSRFFQQFFHFCDKRLMLFVKDCAFPENNPYLYMYMRQFVNLEEKIDKIKKQPYYRSKVVFSLAIQAQV
ncbi:hypothetical protein [Bacillus sp. JJ1562]|uniref:hypothetical protein n=1 Tax=Bacillus sp. JJ1562 TaxID=3122960 RepID=UPI0030034275